MALTFFVTETAAALPTGVCTGWVVQVVDPDAGVQPGPVKSPTLVMVPDAEAGTATAKVTVTICPGVMPDPSVQVMVPSEATLTLHDGVLDDPSVPQLADPATYVVPEGAASVMTSGAALTEGPVFWTVKV